MTHYTTRKEEKKEAKKRRKEKEYLYKPLDSEKGEP